MAQHDCGPMTLFVGPLQPNFNSVIELIFSVFFNLVEVPRTALLKYISALASQYHPSEDRADDQNLEDDEDDSDFEDEAVPNPPAKRRAVTRSQTSGNAAGVTPVLVQDLPAPSRGKAKEEDSDDGDDLGEESDIEDVE